MTEPQLPVPRHRPRVAGLLLAAGSGERYGKPKALVDNGSGPWVSRALDVLRECGPRLVVVGAGSEQVAPLLPPGVTVVQNAAYRDGMGSSLRAGLQALIAADAQDDRRAAGASEAANSHGGGAPRRPQGPHRVDAVLVMLVDLPGVGAAVIDRLLAVVPPDSAGPDAAGPDAAGPDAAGSELHSDLPGTATSVLARAAFAGVPGHPVLLGRDHWAGVIESAVGDRGARDYLRSRPVTLIECGDIGSGADVDVPG